MQENTNSVPGATADSTSDSMAAMCVVPGTSLIFPSGVIATPEEVFFVRGPFSRTLLILALIPLVLFGCLMTPFLGEEDDTGRFISLLFLIVVLAQCIIWLLWELTYARQRRAKVWGLLQTIAANPWAKADSLKPLRESGRYCKVHPIAEGFAVLKHDPVRCTLTVRMLGEEMGIGVKFPASENVRAAAFVRNCREWARGEHHRRSEMRS